MEKIKGSTFCSGSGKEHPLTLFFVRHGQAEKEHVASPDGPTLSELGRKQAERVARRMADFQFHHVYASTMTRAKLTAEMIHVYHKEVPITFTDDLREVTHCHFLPDSVPEDKSGRDLVRREKDSILRFVNHIRHQHSGGQKLLIACHGNIIRTLMPMFGGRDPVQSILMEINNTGVCILDTWSNGEAVLMLANCVRHLLPKQVT